MEKGEKLTARLRAWIYYFCDRRGVAHTAAHCAHLGTQLM